MINREASYFTYTDTTKKAGVPGVHHKWFYLKPAYEYASRKSLANAPAILLKVQTLKTEIEDYFFSREKGVNKGMRPLINNCK